MRNAGEGRRGGAAAQGASWVTDGPPERGKRGLTFVAHPGTANLFVRTEMARR